MSYIRIGHELEHFYGESQSYVFPTGHGEKGEKYIEDYGDKYEDNATFCEIIYRIIRSETTDEEYALKILKILAKKLKIEHMLKEEYKEEK